MDESTLASTRHQGPGTATIGEGTGKRQNSPEFRIHSNGILACIAWFFLDWFGSTTNNASLELHFFACDYWVSILQFGTDTKQIFLFFLLKVIWIK